MMQAGTYARLELLGHRVLHGELSEEEIAGVQFIAIDVIERGEKAVRREYYSAQSIYCIAPMTEDAVLEATRPHVRRIAESVWDEIGDDWNEGD